MRRLVVGGLVATLSGPATAATILAYDTAEGGGPVAPAVESPGLDGADLMRGAGLVPAGDKGFASGGWTVGGSLGESTLNDDFVTFGFSSAPSTAFDLGTLEIALARSEAGPTSVSLTIVGSGVGSGLASRPLSGVDVGTDGHAFSFDLGGAERITSAFFTLSGWNAAGSEGTLTVGPDGEGFGIALTGERVVLEPIPLPAGLPMLAAAIGLLALRRRA